MYFVIFVLTDNKEPIFLQSDHLCWDTRSVLSVLENWSWSPHSENSFWCLFHLNHLSASRLSSFSRTYPGCSDAFDLQIFLLMSCCISRASHGEETSHRSSDSAVVALDAATEQKKRPDNVGRSALETSSSWLLCFPNKHDRELCTVSWRVPEQTVLLLRHWGLKILFQHLSWPRLQRYRSFLMLTAAHPPAPSRTVAPIMAASLCACRSLGPSFSNMHLLSFVLSFPWRFQPS